MLNIAMGSRASSPADANAGAPGLLRMVRYVVSIEQSSHERV